MTEAEWLADDSPLPFLLTRLRDDGITRGAWGRRKLRLFACACCRRVWSLLPDELCRQAVEVSERHADGSALSGEWDAIRQRCNMPRSGPTPASCAAEAAQAAVHRQSWQAAQGAALCAGSAAGMVRGVQQAYDTGFEAERREQTTLLRDIIGNPYRPTPVGTRWLTQNVMHLARAIYEDRVFEQMPILADALMDGGCDVATILGHCQGPGPHVRGCWVVDLLL